MADLSACIAAIETSEDCEREYGEGQPLHLDPNNLDEEVESNDLLRLTHAYGDDEGTDGTGSSDDIGIHAFESEVGEYIVTNEEEEPCKDSTCEIERQQLTTGVGLEEELSEPPQPKHIENDVEGILTEVGMTEHVGEQRPGMREEVV